MVPKASVEGACDFSDNGDKRTHALLPRLEVRSEADDVSVVASRAAGGGLADAKDSEFMSMDWKLV